MKILKFKQFLNESIDNNIDLSLELEYKLRTIDDSSQLTVTDFLKEWGIKEGEMTGFAWGSILKNKQKYSKMTDDEFFKIYNEYKNN